MITAFGTPSPATRNILYTLAAGAVFLFFSSPLYFLSEPHTNLDDNSYIAHVYTIAMDFDFDYSNEVAQKPEGLPKHPVGPGFVAAPVVIPLALVDRTTGHPVVVNRMEYVGSWSYFGFFLASGLAFLLSVPLLFDAVRRLGYSVGAAEMALLVLSTGVVYYGLGRFTMSHSFELFTGSVVVWSTARLLYRTGKRSGGASWCVPILVVATVLTLLTRPNNINVFLVPYIILLLVDLPENNRDMVLRLGMVLVAAHLVAFVVYGAINTALYGDFLPSMDQAYGSTDVSFGGSIVSRIPEILRLMPSLVLILFSSEFGILWNNPVIFFGCAALFWWGATRIHDSGYVIGIGTIILVVLFCAVSFGVVIYWQTTASDYGFRYLYGLIPLCVVAWAWLRYRLSALQMWRAARIAGRGMWILVGVAVLSVFFYKTASSLWPSAKINVFGEFHLASNAGYFGNLLRELVRPSSWMLAFGQGVLGFFAYPLIRGTALMNLVPATAVERHLHLYDEVPSVVYWQFLLALVVWAALGFLYAQWTGRQSSSF